MSKDDRDVSQLRAALWEFIHDAQSEIHANIGVGIWRGHSDPIVVKMQQTVTALIARVRADEEDKFLWRYSAAEQRGYKAGESAGYAAALRDAVEAVKALSFLRVSESDADWVRDEAIEAIAELEGDR